MKQKILNILYWFIGLSTTLFVLSITAEIIFDFEISVICRSIWAICNAIVSICVLLIPELK